MCKMTKCEGIIIEVMHYKVKQKFQVIIEKPETTDCVSPAIVI